MGFWSSIAISVGGVNANLKGSTREKTISNIKVGEQVIDKFCSDLQSDISRFDKDIYDKSMVKIRQYRVDVIILLNKFERLEREKSSSPIYHSLAEISSIWAKSYNKSQNDNRKEMDLDRLCQEIYHLSLTLKRNVMHNLSIKVYRVQAKRKNTCENYNFEAEMRKIKSAKEKIMLSDELINSL